MSRAGVIIAGSLVLALAVAAPSSATHLTLHGCASVKPSASLRANSVKANYRCSSARTALRQLLRHGVSKLPKSKLRPRHWGCLKLAPTWYCTRLGTTPKATKRITFQVKKVENSGLPKPPPPPPPPPPSEVERCVGLWNADTSNASNLGYHFYADHGIRRGWVTDVAAAGGPQCAVVFVVPDTDPEYGLDGEILVNGAWTVMESYELQQQAVGRDNVALTPTGLLTIG